jgi:hypothetical protein
MLRFVAPFNYFQGIEFTFIQTVSASGTSVGIFHLDMHAGRIRRHFQYAVRATLDATPASATIIRNNADHSVPVSPFAIHKTRNPQQKHNSQTDSYYIHELYLLF